MTPDEYLAAVRQVLGEYMRAPDGILGTARTTHFTTTLDIPLSGEYAELVGAKKCFVYLEYAAMLNDRTVSRQALMIPSSTAMRIAGELMVNGAVAFDHDQKNEHVAPGHECKGMDYKSE